MIYIETAVTVLASIVVLVMFQSGGVVIGVICYHCNKLTGTNAIRGGNCKHCGKEVPFD